MQVENVRQFGGPWLALHLIQTLQLDTFLDNAIPAGREHVPWDVSSLILIIARLLEPSSELYIAEQWYPKTALPDLLGVPEERIDDNRLYRALDQRLPHKEALEVHLKERLGGLFQLEYDLLLYDGYKYLLRRCRRLPAGAAQLFHRRATMANIRGCFAVIRTVCLFQ